MLWATFAGVAASVSIGGGNRLENHHPPRLRGQPWPAQENRLDVFRLLVQAGPDGMPAGGVVGLAPNTLTFHFDRL
jgi:hypothetical protein